MLPSLCDCYINQPISYFKVKKVLPIFPILIQAYFVYIYLFTNSLLPSDLGPKFGTISLIAISSGGLENEGICFFCSRASTARVMGEIS